MVTAELECQKCTFKWEIERDNFEGFDEVLPCPKCGEKHQMKIIKLNGKNV